MEDEFKDHDQRNIKNVVSAIMEVAGRWRVKYDCGHEYYKYERKNLKTYKRKRDFCAVCFMQRKD